MDNVLEHWRERIAHAKKQHRPLRFEGAGSKNFYGKNPQAWDCTVIDTRDFSGVVSHEPTELVVTVRAGTPWRVLADALAERNQCLPFDPPFVDQGATVGGVINAGLTGASRLHVGGIRDFGLGAQMMDTHGELLSFGGQVMKNVAGYDVSRLLVGSMGTLGLLTQVSLKVVPQPAAQQTLFLNCDYAVAQIIARKFLVHPVAINASAWFENKLSVRLCGALAAVESSIDHLNRWAQSLTRHDFIVLDSVDAHAFWQSLNEQTHQHFNDAPSPEHTLWRAVLPTHIDGLTVHPYTGLAMWGGALRWIWSTDDLRAVFAAAGGYATAYRVPEHVVWVTPSNTTPALNALRNSVKAQFDPLDLFNPHRLDFVGGHHAP